MLSVAAGEKFLESIERNQNYPLLLLQLLDAPTTPPHLRISAAITVKNYVKRNWKIVRSTFPGFLYYNVYYWFIYIVSYIYCL